MSERSPALYRLTRWSTGLVSVTSLGVVAVSWVVESRPVDPGQLPAVTVPAAVTVQPPAAFPDAVPVIAFHRVCDHDRSPGTLTRRRFAEHLAALRAAGYRTVRLADLRGRLNPASQPASAESAHAESASARSASPADPPSRKVLLTFDDGALTDWTSADRILAAYRFTAVAFVISDRIARPGTRSRYLSSRQLQRMRATGRWEFGSHTAGLHGTVATRRGERSLLTTRITVSGRPERFDQWHRRVATDLARSQRFFRRVLGHPVTAFSYPFGDSGATSDPPEIAPRLRTLLAEAGFDLAFAGEGQTAGPADAVTATSDRWRLPRIGTRSSTTAAQLLTRISKATPALPPTDLTTLTWTGRGARCETTAGVSIRVLVASRDFGSCLVDNLNTGRWSDYTMSTRLVGVSRVANAVIAVRDGIATGTARPPGRVEVVVGERLLILRQRVPDVGSLVLASAPNPSPSPDEIAIQVRGSQVTVAQPGRPPMVAAIDPALSSGGVTLAAAGLGSPSIGFLAPTLSFST